MKEGFTCMFKMFESSKDDLGGCFEYKWTFAGRNCFGSYISYRDWKKHFHFSCNNLSRVFGFGKSFQARLKFQELFPQIRKHSRWWCNHNRQDKIQIHSEDIKNLNIEKHSSKISFKLLSTSATFESSSIFVDPGVMQSDCRPPFAFVLEVARLKNTRFRFT